MVASSSGASSANSGTCFRIAAPSMLSSFRRGAFAAHCDRSQIAVAVYDLNPDRVRIVAPQLLRPLDRQHAALRDLVEPEIVELARIVQPIQVDVKQRQPAAAVFLNERECRAAHLVARD